MVSRREVSDIPSEYRSPIPAALILASRSRRGLSSHSPAGQLSDLGAQPIGEGLVPAAPGVSDDLLLQLGHFAKDTEARLHALDDRGGLDAFRCLDQPLDVGPVVVAPSDLLEERLGIERVAGLPELQHGEPSQELAVEGHRREPV